MCCDYIPWIIFSIFTISIFFIILYTTPKYKHINLSQNNSIDIPESVKMYNNIILSTIEKDIVDSIMFELDNVLVTKINFYGISSWNWENNNKSFSLDGHHLKITYGGKTATIIIPESIRNNIIRKLSLCHSKYNSKLRSEALEYLHKHI